MNSSPPPSRTTNLHNEISNFQKWFVESFHEACNRYKDLLRAFPHHGFTELHQLDTFYSALNPADQHSLNAAAGGNLLERRTQDVLTIIENKSKRWNQEDQLPQPIHGNITSFDLAKIDEAIRMARRLMDQAIRVGTILYMTITITATTTTTTPITTREGVMITKGVTTKIPITETKISTTIINKIIGRRTPEVMLLLLLPQLEEEGGAHRKVYVLGDKNAQQDPNMVTGMFLLNNHYAIILFDSGAEKSFVSIALASLLNITPTTLDIAFTIELASGKDRSGTRPNIISCVKPQKYIRRGCCMFLAHIIEKKSEEKRLKDVPIVCDFPKVFPEDLPGLPPPRQVEFQIELVSGVTPVAGAPYCLAPSWDKDEEEAFHLLKEKLCSTPILALPDGSEDFVVYCDASDQDALSRKKRLKPLRVRSLGMMIISSLPAQILEAQTKAIKEENVKNENLYGMIKKKFQKRLDGTLCFKGRSWILLYGGVRDLIMHETHNSNKCLTCSKIKAECQKPSGLLQQPEIPVWKWEITMMDFDTKLPKTPSGYDANWKAFRTQLDMSTAYHPQTDGQSERTIQTLEDMLRACIIDFGNS
nr:putative reverse transcriptase domain-containing protein [Tanacetum cinerariifolium]